MSGHLWHLTQLIARILQPAEREAVLGDLLESGHSTTRALRDILGLTLRRAVRGIVPHIASPLLALPLALLLTVLARNIADFIAIYLWLWTGNLDTHLLTTSGYWHGVTDTAPELLLACSSLILWSWSSSALAARYSRSTAILFCTALLLLAPLGAPAFLTSHLSLIRARDFHSNDAVFRSLFYRSLFPCLVQCLFVLVPALTAIQKPTQETVS